MTQVGSILQSTRLELGYTIVELSKKLKIPVKYIEAIESGQTYNYPREPYCSLLVKDYADFLGLHGQEIAKIFRRDYAENKQPKIVLIKDTGINPRLTFFASIIIVVIFSLFYLVNEYLKFSRPPQLEATITTNQTSKIIEIKGKTNPDSTLRIDDDLIIIDADGRFTKTIDLESNLSQITITSKSPAGKITTLQKSVY